MSKSFSELKERVKNVDRQQAMGVVKDIKAAHANGKIDEKEKDELLTEAKSVAGDMDLEGFGGKSS